MKQKLLITIFIVLIALMSFPTGRVFADDEAGAAAELAYHMPISTTDTRITRLRAFLESYGSPLAADAKTFIEEADRNNLDWKLVAAIAGVESTFGQAIPRGSYNAWGWGIPTGAQDGIHFKDWADGIAQVSEGLKTRYFVNGTKTIYDIGWIYAANGNSWSSHVSYFLNKLEQFQPDSPDQLTVSI